MRKNTLLASLALSLFAVAGSASAGSNSGTLIVQADITPECIVQDSDLNFGSKGGLFLADEVVPFTIGVQCNDAGVGYSVSLDLGQNGGSAGSRNMASGANRLSYFIYQDAGLTTKWADGGMGNGGQFSNTSTAGVGIYDNLQGYGVIPSGVSVPSGAYDDSVSIIVSF